MRHEPGSKRKWWVIAAIVLALHLSLLLFVRPEYFDFVLRDVNAPPGASSSGGAAYPDAIIAIPIDVEPPAQEAPPEPAEPVAEVPSQERPAASEQDEGDDGDGGSGGELGAIDLGDILGDAAQPRGGGGATREQTVPPRPVEITWPETSRLKHCIGRHVNVRILVGEDGRIREVTPASAEVPADCLAAALDAARRIKFSPGRVGGRPAALWAQVRIDFEEKR